MKRLLLITVILVLFVSITWGQSVCLTPKFQQARIDLYNQFGGSKGPSQTGLDITLHEVGDTMTFWAWDLTVMPPVWILIPATCRAVTEFSYIFVADDQWNVHMDSADVDLVEYYWAEGTYNDSTAGIYELDTENFGMPPDELDDDDHIYIFYSELGSFGGSIFDGYFSIFNEYTEEEAQQLGGHSNEVEMFYMSCNPGNPTSPIRISVLAHEFEHMIHWGIDPNEDTWVDEGCAEYAMLLFGYPDPLVDFPNNPDDDLTIWGSQFLDYIQTFMFFTYIADHYGGAATIREVVQQQQNSIYGVQAALMTMGYEETFEQVFVDWTIANFYHGRGGAESPDPDSQYIYYSIDPPAFNTSSWHTNYPAGPYNRSVNSLAADYIAFGNPQGDYNQLIANFTGNSGLEFGLGIIGMEVSGNMHALSEYPVDDPWEEIFNDFSQHEYIALAVSGPASYSSFNYSYSADVAVGIENIEPLPNNFSINAYPNPFNASTTISYTLPEPSDVTLEVYNILGQNIATLVDENQQAGQYNIKWDAGSLTTGLYFYRIQTDRDVQTQKLVLLK